MGIKFKKFEPTEYVLKIRKGKVVARGQGLSFFYNTMTTSMLVLPTTAFDAAFAFDEVMTSDFQSVKVQGDIAYSIVDFEKAARMENFAFANSRREYLVRLSEAKTQMAKRITNLAKVYVTKFIRERSVRDAIMAADELAADLRENLRQDATIQEFGLQVVSLSVLGISAGADTKRALEAATRDEILKMQDDAIYKRRNAAIEQERIVRENELNTEIKVAEKEKQKKEKEMETKRMLQEKQAELSAKKLEHDICLEEENRKLVELQTENERKKSDARAYDSEVLLKALSGIEPEIIKALAVSGMDSKALIAKAFSEIGDKADKIGVLNVSPELLEALAGRSSGSQ